MKEANFELSIYFFFVSALKLQQTNVYQSACFDMFALWFAAWFFLLYFRFANIFSNTIKSLKLKNNNQKYNFKKKTILI